MLRVQDAINPKLMLHSRRQTETTKRMSAELANEVVTNDHVMVLGFSNFSSSMMQTLLLAFL